MIVRQPSTVGQLSSWYVLGEASNRQDDDGELGEADVGQVDAPGINRVRTFHEFSLHQLLYDSLESPPDLSLLLVLRHARVLLHHLHHVGDLRSPEVQAGGLDADVDRRQQDEGTIHELFNVLR